MIKRLTSLSLIFVSIGLVCTIANVPAALSIENPSVYMLAQLKNSDAASPEIRSSGKLILGPDLEVYIIFSKGEQIAEPVRGFISGVPRDLTQEEADTNVIQYHTMEAWDAWLRCLEAREKAKNKEISEEQADLVCAEAREKNALLNKVTATIMLLNPFADQQEWEDKLFEAEQELLDAANDMQALIDAGAEPFTGETFTVGIPDLDPPSVPVETTWQRLPLEDSYSIAFRLLRPRAVNGFVSGG